MDKKYIIMCRYERWGANGKEFTKWFAHVTTPMSKEDAEERIKQTKKDFGFIDQKTHLKHEYVIKEYDEYLNEQAELLKALKESEQKQKEYFQSAEYKELQKKKRQSAKERKERQQKYKLEHGI